MPVFVATIDHPTRADLFTYLGAMLLMIAVGVTGAVLHILINLTAGGEVAIERFIRGAPFLAPLLFANIGSLGLIAMLDPGEGVE